MHAHSRVILAPNVLVHLITQALREVPGLARTGKAPRSRAIYRGDGVALYVDAATIRADCYLIAQAGTNLLELGMAVQATVAAVMQELAGMIVREVNVYIQDVEANCA